MLYLTFLWNEVCHNREEFLILCKWKKSVFFCSNYLRKCWRLQCQGIFISIIVEMLELIPNKLNWANLGRFWENNILKKTWINTAWQKDNISKICKMKLKQNRNEIITAESVSSLWVEPKSVHLQDRSVSSKFGLQTSNEVQSQTVRKHQLVAWIITENTCQAKQFYFW